MTCSMETIICRSNENLELVRVINESLRVDKSVVTPRY